MSAAPTSADGPDRQTEPLPVPAAGPPTFVACCARSGSTLLRWLIDAHPELSCPGETDLAVVLNGYLRIATDLGRAAGAGVPPVDRTRIVAEELMQTYLERVGKSRWCDKSLSNVFHLELLASIWPDARFVLLHRHCMDFVMNGLEVSPWGLAEYGFAQVAQMSPTDSVVALAAYWVDRTTRMVSFENRHPDRCLRVRYEDLVADTDGVLARLWDFLGVRRVDGVSTSAFAVEHSSFGAADHEIWYTSGVHGDSVGRGARIPPDHVVDPLRASVNALLAQLGYSTIGDDWGSGGDPPLKPLTPSLDGRSPLPSALVELRIVDGHNVLHREVVDLARTVRSTTELDRAGDGVDTVGFVVAIEHGALRDICTRTENIGTALRLRSVRGYGRLPPLFRDEHEVYEHLVAWLADKQSELLAINRSIGR